MRKFKNNISGNVVSAFLIASVSEEGMVYAQDLSKIDTGESVVDSNIDPIKVSPQTAQRISEIADSEQDEWVYLVDLGDVLAPTGKSSFESKYTEQVDEPEADAEQVDEPAPDTEEAETRAAEADQEQAAEE